MLAVVQICWHCYRVLWYISESAAPCWCTDITCRVISSRPGSWGERAHQPQAESPSSRYPTANNDLVVIPSVQQITSETIPSILQLLSASHCSPSSTSTRTRASPLIAVNSGRDRDSSCAAPVTVLQATPPIPSTISSPTDLEFGLSQQAEPVIPTRTDSCAQLAQPICHHLPHHLTCRLRNLNQISALPPATCNVQLAASKTPTLATIAPISDPPPPASPAAEARLCQSNRTVFASPPPIPHSCSHGLREHFLPTLPQASRQDLATPHKAC